MRSIRPPKCLQIVRSVPQATARFSRQLTQKLNQTLADVARTVQSHIVSPTWSLLALATARKEVGGFASSGTPSMVILGTVLSLVCASASKVMALPNSLVSSYRGLAAVNSTSPIRACLSFAESVAGEICTVVSSAVGLTVRMRSEGLAIVFLAPVVGTIAASGQKHADSGARSLQALQAASAHVIEQGQARLQVAYRNLTNLAELKTVNVQSDLESRVARGEISSEEARTIYAELLALNDVNYRVPSEPQSLNQALGFAREAALAPEDHVYLMDVHVQVTLSVSTLTASYLTAHMGISAVPTLAGATGFTPDAQSPATQTP